MRCEICQKIAPCVSVDGLNESGWEATKTGWMCDRCCKVNTHMEELANALVKLWKHTPKIDNGRCMVCRIGYVSMLWGKDMIGRVSPCDQPDCLSHVITDALKKSGKLPC